MLLDYSGAHCAYVPGITIHFGSILILNHWRGSGEWHVEVLQIEEMIVSTKYKYSKS